MVFYLNKYELSFRETSQKINFLIIVNNEITPRYITMKKHSVVHDVCKIIERDIEYIEDIEYVEFDAVIEKESVEGDWELDDGIVLHINYRVIELTEIIKKEQGFHCDHGILIENLYSDVNIKIEKDFTYNKSFRINNETISTVLNVKDILSKLIVVSEEKIMFLYKNCVEIRDIKLNVIKRFEGKIISFNQNENFLNLVFNNFSEIFDLEFKPKISEKEYRINDIYGIHDKKNNLILKLNHYEEKQNFYITSDDRLVIELETEIKIIDLKKLTY